MNIWYKSYIWAVLWAGWLWPMAMHAQQYTFLQYSVREGLAQSQVRCLRQDERGFIWAGTLDGLSRFDGQNFRNYYTRDGLFGNQINCLTPLHDGRLAVGHNGGITLLNALSAKAVALPDNWKESPVNAISEILRPDGNYLLYLCTDDGLLVMNSKGEVQPVLERNIRKLLLLEDGRLLAVAKNGLYLQTENDFKLVYKPASEKVNLFDLMQWQGRWCLAAKDAGLLVSDSLDNFQTVAGFEEVTITGITAGDNALWLSSRFGFYKYTTDGKSRLFSELNGMPVPDVRDVLMDHEGNCWLATNGGGLLRFTGEQFSAYTTADGLCSNAVMCIAEEPNGTLWFGSFDGGVCRKDSSGFKAFTLREFTGNNRMWCALAAAAGEVWFGSSNGLYRFQGDKITRYSESDSLADRVVLSLCADDNEKIWIGTAHGLSYWNGQSLNKVVTSTMLDELRVRRITRDKAGQWWFATNGGVWRFDGKSYVMFTTLHGLPSPSTYSVENDELNRMWVATQEGLAVFNGKSFSKVEMPFNHGSSTINFLKYHKGRLWAGTNMGLMSLLAGHAEGEIEHLQQFGLEDGLRELETNLNSAFFDRNGHLWFGTPGGAVVFNPEGGRTPGGTPPPRVLIDKVMLNLRDADWSKMGFTPDARTALPLNPRVSYRNNHFTFYFTGISTTYPEEVRYQYMLEGYDEDWNAPTEARFAIYNNLPYDSYRFRVRTSVRNGVWSDDASFSFSIAPPFWLTWWFILLEVAAIAAVFMLIYNARRRIVRARYEREKFEMQSRMLALEQQSLNSSMNRHFIFNALNSIQYYINRQDRLAANKYLSEFARLIRKNLDSSQHNLTTLREEIERLELYLSLEHMRFKDKFEYRIHVADEVDPDAVKVPAMLLQPFLENSIWHGLLPKPTPGLVEVDISRLNGSIEFTITDNGIGIESSRQGKNPDDNHISKGMEITSGRIDLIKKMTSQQVELHGPYQLYDEHRQPAGTRVRIVLPYDFHELFPN